MACQLGAKRHATLAVAFFAALLRSATAPSRSVCPRASARKYSASAWQSFADFVALRQLAFADTSICCLPHAPHSGR